MQKFKAIFFDVDGLLVETEPLYFQATREVFARFGVDITREWYIRENLGKGTSTFDLLHAAQLDAPRIEEVRIARDAHYTNLLSEVDIPVVEGVRETLDAINGKFTMGIVTTGWRRNFDIIMAKSGLRSHFSFSITGDDVQNVKPHPEPYLKALAHVGFTKDECLVLEDSRRGVQAAKAAGLACFAIPDTLTKTHDFSIADKVLGSIRELPKLIL